MYSIILKKAHSTRFKACEVYRRLHNIAEEGLHLPNTVSFVKKRLRELSIDFCDCGGGIVASVGEGDRCVLLRADMDALPFTEKTGLPYASETGCMHACGHDMHTAMLLCAASILRDLSGELSGKVRLCFQPGEETLSGALSMIEAGLLSPAPVAAAMIHVITACDYETGTLIIPPSGVFAAAADHFCVTVTGRGSHGAAPHTARDPIACAANILSALYPLTARESTPERGSLLTVGRIKGGSAANAIPDTCTFSGTLRTFSDEEREYLKMRIESIAKAVAEAFLCSSAVDFYAGVPAFINDPSLTTLCRNTFSHCDPPAVILPEGVRGGASEDFAFVSQRVPTVMLTVSAGQRSDGFTEPLHSPKMRLSEDALPYGAAAYAAFAMAALKEKE